MGQYTNVQHTISMTHDTLEFPVQWPVYQDKEN